MSDLMAFFPAVMFLIGLGMGAALVMWGISVGERLR